MSELPDELRALLNMARDGHDPTDPDARLRVRSAVAASLLISGGTAGSVFPQAAASNTQTLGGALKAGKLGFTAFGGKLSALALGAVAAVGLGVASYGYSHQHAEPLQRATAPAASSSAVLVAQPLPASEPAPALPPSVEAAAAPAPVAATDVASKPVRAARAEPSAASLAAETLLLRAASEALAAGDAPAALAQLRAHAQRFPQGSLREERDGLRAIAECSRTDAPSSASAKRFLRQYPSSLLGGRVRKACAAL